MKMLSMRRWATMLPLALVATAACGGSDGTGPGSDECSITLTGAETGTAACSNVLAAWTSEDNLFDFGFTSAGGSVNTIVVSVGSTGKPATKTYHSTDAGAGAGIAVTNGTNGWQAGVASASPAIGSYDLTISSLSTIASAADGEVYRLHGKLVATLEPDASTGATGTVTLTATF
jgi:hypothetical protein